MVSVATIPRRHSSDEGSGRAPSQKMLFTKQQWLWDVGCGSLVYSKATEHWQQGYFKLCLAEPPAAEGAA